MSDQTTNTSNILDTRFYLDKDGLRHFYGIISKQWEAGYTAADEALASEFQGKLDALEEAYKAADTEINGNITTINGQITDLTAALAAEVTARGEGDAAVRNEFAAADTALKEELVGTDGYASLTAAKAAVTELSGDLDTHKTAYDAKMALLDAEDADIRADFAAADTALKEELVGTDGYASLTAAKAAVEGHKESEISISMDTDGNITMSGAHSGSGKFDLSKLVLDNYIDSITYHATAEEGVDTVAPYIKFEWATTGDNPEVIRISVADLVGIVEAGDSYITVTPSNNGLDDDTSSNYKVSISEAFIKAIWGDDATAAGESIADLRAALDGDALNLTNHITAYEAKMALLDAEDAAIRTAFAEADATLKEELVGTDGYASLTAAKAAVTELSGALDTHKAAYDAKIALLDAEDAAIRAAFAEADTALETRLKGDNGYASLTEAKTAVEGVSSDLDTHKAAYEAKIALLDAEDADIRADFAAADTALKEELVGTDGYASLTAAKAAVEGVSSALDTHKTAYDTKVAELEAKDTELSGAINDLEGNLKGYVDEAIAGALEDMGGIADKLEGAFATRVTDIENWINTTGALSTADIDEICGVESENPENE
jgi:hypothetical protein